ncbi:MAG: VWA domain-containing protein [Pseudomonadota bacterium]
MSVGRNPQDIGTAANRDDGAASLEAVYARGAQRWSKAAEVATLLAIDPRGLGGVHVVGGSAHAQKTWLDGLMGQMPGLVPLVMAPAYASTSALVGSVAIDRSLSAGELIPEPGLMTRADGGVLVARMADMLPAERAAILGTAMDQGRVQIEQAGLSCEVSAAFTLVMLEGGEEETRVAPVLTDRAAFQVVLDGIPTRCIGSLETRADQVQDARALLPRITVPPETIEAIARACSALGIKSARAPLFTLRAARAFAAQDGRVTVCNEDIEAAASLVLAHRARALPSPEDDEAEANSPEDPLPEAPNDPADDQESETVDRPLEDTLIEAVSSAALARVLDGFATNGTLQQARQAKAGRAGMEARKQDNGRPDRPVPRERKRDGRIDLLATLQCAAPFQKLRSRQRPSATHLHLRPSDLRVKTYRHRRETSVIFVVDASGSSALNRIGEAKGAIEHLLSDCYSRRDQVSLIAVRGREPECLLPPTRALTRVRRALAALPSGGTTPLAGALLMAGDLARREARAGRSPFLVILSDGRGNVALDGSTDAAAAETDLQSAARQAASCHARTLFFDTSRRPSERAKTVAAALNAQYRHLPFASAGLISGAVQANLKAAP